MDREYKNKLTIQEKQTTEAQCEICHRLIDLKRMMKG